MKLQRYITRKLFLFTFILSIDAYAEIYRWEDENGQVHFSSKAPDKIKSEVQEIQKSKGISFSPHQHKLLSDYGVQDIQCNSADYATCYAPILNVSNDSLAGQDGKELAKVRAQLQAVLQKMLLGGLSSE